MPYFIFRIPAEKDIKPELVDSREKFPEANKLCKTLRKDMVKDDGAIIKMMFAEDESEARRLIRTKKIAAPVEEWEK
ncbi:MAG: hypothetical protein OEX83_03125 [Gammaproteobacteria bacterium]|nr:hypothetical protein [Gammaproteobacteria bacterium]